MVGLLVVETVVSMVVKKAVPMVAWMVGTKVASMVDW